MSGTKGQGPICLTLSVFTSSLLSVSTLRLLLLMMNAAIGFALTALPVALAATFDVSVGAGGNLTYDPPFLNAAVGDVVNFMFNPKNHTATQSSFDAPCVPLAGGFNSGFMPVAAGTTDLPTFQVVVNDTNPVWVHCEQTGHCGQGMVFAINPPADPSPHSFSAFRALAIALNGTNATTSAASSTTSITSVADQSWSFVTATVTLPTATYTTSYTSYDGTPPPTPTSQPIDHKISVGAGGLVFSPSNISASIGDTVTFEFETPKTNHTATQSSFSHPCQPLADTSTTGQVGFDAGFNPVAADATTFPSFQITINDTAPIWGFCGQTGHCGQGMVFSINAVESGPNNFAAFLNLAKELNGTSSSSSGTSTGTTTSASSTSTEKSGAVSLSRSVFNYGAVLAVIGALTAAF